MRRAILQLGGIAPVAHLVAEPVDCEWLTVLSDEIGQITRRCVCQRDSKLSADRNVDGPARLVLAAPLVSNEPKPPVHLMLTTEPGSIRNPGADIQEYFKCEGDPSFRRGGAADIARPLQESKYANRLSGGFSRRQPQG